MAKYLMIQGTGSSFAANSIEQVQIAGAEVVVAPYSTITEKYVKEDTGVVTASSAHTGFLYAVTAGDVVNIYCTKDADGGAAQFRYGTFSSSTIAAGARASQYGTNLIDTNTAFSPIRLVIGASGYLMVTSSKPVILPVTIVVKRIVQ